MKSSSASRHASIVPASASPKKSKRGHPRGALSSRAVGRGGPASDGAPPSRPPKGKGVSYRSVPQGAVRIGCVSFSRFLNPSSRPPVVRWDGRCKGSRSRPAPCTFHPAKPQGRPSEGGPPSDPLARCKGVTEGGGPPSGRGGWTDGGATLFWGAKPPRGPPLGPPMGFPPRGDLGPVIRLGDLQGRGPRDLAAGRASTRASPEQGAPRAEGPLGGIFMRGAGIRSLAGNPRLVEGFCG